MTAQKYYNPVHYSSGQTRTTMVSRSNSGQARLPTLGRSNSGQALAELIIACAILAITLFGVVATINFAVTTVALSTNKTRANYYAQEGLEQARAARNADWVSFANASYLGGNNNVPIPIAGTIFMRTITIADAGITGDNDARVTSLVTWFDGTTEYESRLVTVLTNH